jgi:hypothetical protein
MSIVLGVLAALCTVCGLAALYFGYDLGGTERGVAYTVSGTIATSAGAVMVGITVLAVRLSQLARLLGAVPGLARRVADEPAVPLSGSTLPPARDQRPGLPGTVLPGEIGIAAVAAAATALGPGEAMQGRAESDETGREAAVAATPAPPDVGVFAPRALPEINLGLDDLLAPAPPAAASDEATLKEHAVDAPDDLDADHPETDAPEPAPSADAEPEAEPAPLTRGRDRLGGIFGPPATPPEAPAPEEEPAAAGPDDASPTETSDTPAEADIEDLPPWHGGAQFTPEPPVPAEEDQPADDEPSSTAEPVAAPEEPGRKVIGSYMVGPNSYTMYGDGSVEALTPNGLYSFASLEELRNFIEKGGSPAASSG